MKFPRLSALFLILSVIMMSISGCGLLGNDPCDPGVLDMLKLQPPPSAAGLTESCVPGFAPGNAQYKATFTMSPDELQAFQESTLITDWQIDAADASVWDSEATNASSVLFGTYGDGFYMQEVLIVTGDPATYKVYFFNAIVD